MKNLALLFLALLISASLPSCATYQRLRSPKTKTTAPASQESVAAPKLVGQIASISPDKKFVLIQSYGKWAMDVGSILTTRGGDDRTANLLTTGESLGTFAAADIQAGSVEVNDAVYSPHVPKPATAAPAEIAAPQNVQKNN